jgi:hypothetical protein
MFACPQMLNGELRPVWAPSERSKTVGRPGLIAGQSIVATPTRTKPAANSSAVRGSRRVSPGGR